MSTRSESNKKYDAGRIKIVSAIYITPAQAERMEGSLALLDDLYPSRRAAVLAAVLAHAEEMDKAG